MGYVIELSLGTDAAADAAAARLAGEIVETGNERFLRALLPGPVEFQQRSVETLLSTAGEDPEPTVSLLLRAMHLAFAAHLPLSLSPDVLWCTVVQEVAVHVRLNQDACAGLFTDTPGERQTVTVRDDRAPEDWGRSIRLVEQPLRELIGEDTATLLLPAFSTTTPADAGAALVALMDVVSPYYRFKWRTLCGIPQIRLTGTAEDWRVLADRIGALQERFTGLHDWLAALGPVLEQMAATAAGQGVDEEFWRSLYKHRSGSGGPSVTGWINAFFAHRYTDEGPEPKEEFGPGTAAEETFPSHVSTVPFEWETPAGTFEMVFLGGVLGLTREDGWLTPRLGHAVAHLLPRPAQLPGRLPEPWTIDTIRLRTATPTARLLDPLGTVTHLGEPLAADLALEVGAFCLVRATDGGWYLGEHAPATGDIECWEYVGPDLDRALHHL
ncbi:hypothetical protein CFP65_1159 [Kitasatospora sp. MMS16-BH015]|uniref:DUF4419 domain-containing protein n=1 Tax=Kitasatospora sp. MMS16-BH015 TaxID=2018025 RepID=UPI000CA1B086|nr:DUF4419 domain-containing protein [Kitasatospora sp. MMS16-BH015]AUG76069.1 hypothetical protein CFP65_1159 [Kitasatospora sp. MMS16-BH015]